MPEARGGQQVDGQGQLGRLIEYARHADRDEAVRQVHELTEQALMTSGMRGLIPDHARGQGLVIQRPSAADGLRLVDARLPSLRLAFVRARGVVAVGLHARGIDVYDCHLPDTDLSNADFSRGRRHQVAIDRVKLTGAVLTDLFLRQVSGLDTDATGQGLTATECTFIKGIFVGFAGRYATFRNCNFHAADLWRAYLYRASFIGDPPASAAMVEANLDGANLTQTYLAADFSSAKVGGQRGAIFADHCTGLLPALRAAWDPDSQRLAKLVEELTELLNSDSGKST